MRKIQTVVALCLLSSMAMAECVDNIVPTTPTDNFDISAGTVLDAKTGLMWKQCAEGLSGDDCEEGEADTLTWADALEQVETLNSDGGFAEHTDWRLPNIKELQTLVEERCEGPARNEDVFPGDYASQLWSSSPTGAAASAEANSAWYVRVSDGITSNDSRVNTNGIHLVRGG